MDVQVGPSVTASLAESAWHDQAVWSEAANQLGTDLSQWRFRAAVAGVVGAVCETLAGSLANVAAAPLWLGAGVALLGAVILALVPYIAKTRVSKDQARQWVRARAASEALKSEIYRFLVGAPPYGENHDANQFNTKREEILKRVTDLNEKAAQVDPPHRDRPLSLTYDGYLKERLDGQIDGYYLPQGRANALKSRQIHQLEFGLGVLAVIMGALVSAGPAVGLPWLAGLGGWVAVVTTASAAVTAHLASARYDQNAITYFGTANQLRLRRDNWNADALRMQPDHFQKFADDVESIIAAQNTAWLLDWTKEEQQADGTAGISPG